MFLRLNGFTKQYIIARYLGSTQLLHFLTGAKLKYVIELLKMTQSCHSLIVDPIFAFVVMNAHVHITLYW